jgi:DUF4097 and DUF4098 domain-containing protein YvlB
VRRGSLIGPLLLIVIGGLFLVNNVRPDLPVFRIVAEYWPFLLIAWGLIRLIEIGIGWMSGRALPPTGVTGGEWVLVVFITLIGSGFFAAYRYTGGDWPGRVRINSRAFEEVFGETYQFQLSARHKAGKTPKIVIENLRGNTRVIAADVEEVAVSGRTTIRAFDQAQADKTNQECPLEIVPQGDKLMVRTNHDRASGSLRINADIEITVPRGASVEARGRNGDFEITDLAGDVDINSDNAGVRLQNIGGGVRCELRRSDIVRAINVKGGVELKGGGHDVELESIGGEVAAKFPFTGELIFRKLAKPLRLETRRTELRVERLPGYLRMTSGNLTASELVGPVRVTTRSTDVQISDFTDSIELHVDRGDVELRPGRLPLPKIDVRSGSGEIDLALPDGARFQLTARTGRGELRNDFGSLLGVQEEARGGTMRGGVAGGTVVSLETNRGSITVSKSSSIARPLEAPPQPPAAPAPPRPPLTLEREKQ